jgi:hypothetical protein
MELAIVMASFFRTEKRVVKATLPTEHLGGKQQTESLGWTL